MACSIAKAALFGTLALVYAGRQEAKATPMEKVISLLEDLSAKIQKEGKKEAAQYDKFACFCKEQVDEKTASIEKSAERIERLTKEEGLLDSDISELTSEDGELKEKIDHTEHEIEDDKVDFAEIYEKYKAQVKDSQEAIAAVDAAMKIFEDALSSQKDEWHDDLDLLQVKQLQKVLEKHTAALPVTSLLAKLVKGDRSDPTMSTRGILASLKALQKTFKTNLKDMEEDEAKAKLFYDKEILALSTEKKFMGEEVVETERSIDSKTADEHDVALTADEEQKAKAADEAYLHELTNQCEEKAELFRQRSSTRVNEITSIADAIEVLKKGKPEGGTVGKMAEIQKAEIAKMPAAVSFLQRGQGKQDALKRVRAVIDQAVRKTGSNTLTALAVKVKLAGDGFAKVRGIIDDLLARLKEDALAEADKKSWCDKEMKGAIDSRDDATSRSEAANAEITRLNADKASLVRDVEDLRKDIAAVKKALNEAQELRMEEKADNARTEAIAENARTSVELALKVLTEFYESAALVQTKSHKYTPEGADRSGKTVSDGAPEVFDSTYHGATDESKGVIGILEVCHSDFERVVKATQDEEAEAEEHFDHYKEDAEADMADKEAIVKNKEGEIEETKGDLVTRKEEVKDAETQLGYAHKDLDALKASCVDAGKDSWEERSKKRQAEIDALKDAIDELSAIRGD